MARRRKRGSPENPSAPVFTSYVFTNRGEPTPVSSVESASQALQHALTKSDDSDSAPPFLWMELTRPTAESLGDLAHHFSLPPLAIEDSVEAHQRPKYERYGDTTFVVVRPASTSEHNTSATQSGTQNTELPSVQNTVQTTVQSAIKIGELHFFIGTHFLLVVQPSDTIDLDSARKIFTDSILNDHGVYSSHPVFSAVYRILDQIVDAYSPILDTLEDISDDLEAQIFAGQPAKSRDIYELSRQAIDLERSVRPLPTVLGNFTTSLNDHRLAEELRHGFRDVTDHANGLVERVGRLRNLLREIFTVNSTIIAETQNDQMKKISSWAGILFFPSLVAGTYGMNFDHMPELHWALGYPMALGIMVAGSLIFFAIFKKLGWL